MESLTLTNDDQSPSTAPTCLNLFADEDDPIARSYDRFGTTDIVRLEFEARTTTKDR
jgi:hypothetical protein